MTDQPKYTPHPIKTGPKYGSDGPPPWSAILVIWLTCLADGILLGIVWTALR